MRHFHVGTWILAGTLLLPGARPLSAQIAANVQISWHWSDDGWRSAGPIVDGYVHWTDARDRGTARYDPAPVRGRVLPVGFRVPPGHMPPAGMCRAWVVGLPPGHQPPPQPCARVFRIHRGAEVVILHSPARNDRKPKKIRERNRWEDWDERWGRDRGGRGRGGG